MFNSFVFKAEAEAASCCSLLHLVPVSNDQSFDRKRIKIETPTQKSGSERRRQRQQRQKGQQRQQGQQRQHFTPERLNSNGKKIRNQVKKMDPCEVNFSLRSESRAFSRKMKLFLPDDALNISTFWV